MMRIQKMRDIIRATEITVIMKSMKIMDKAKTKYTVFTIAFENLTCVTTVGKQRGSSRSVDMFQQSSGKGCAYIFL